MTGDEEKTEGRRITHYLSPTPYSKIITQEESHAKSNPTT